MFGSLLRKSLVEQIRSVWILILTVTLAPFFVFVYSLISETESVHYNLLVLNQDLGADWEGENVNLGVEVIQYLLELEPDSIELPLTVRPVDDLDMAIERLQQGRADALIVLPRNFSQHLVELSQGGSTAVPIEFIGDLTNIAYMVTAVWASEFIQDMVHSITRLPRPIHVVETALGRSGSLDAFTYYMPGLLILSLVMLMFSATIAIITEVDQGTILRLKLSKLSVVKYLSAVTVVQLGVGFISILLTLAVAVAMGFELRGSLGPFLVITTLTSLSIISFSLILAAFTRSVTEVLIVGNFPLFLFMFFTGAAFPLHPRTLVEVGGYSMGWNGLLSATHGVDALRQVMLFGKGLPHVWPQLLFLTALTIGYAILGGWLFKRRHLKVD